MSITSNVQKVGKTTLNYILVHSVTLQNLTALLTINETLECLTFNKRMTNRLCKKNCKLMDVYCFSGRMVLVLRCDKECIFFFPSYKNEQKVKFKSFS